MTSKETNDDEHDSEPHYIPVETSEIDSEEEYWNNCSGEEMVDCNCYTFFNKETLAKIKHKLETEQNLEKVLDNVEEYTTALCFAISEDMTPIIMKLIKAGIGINGTSGSRRKTPLHFAIERHMDQDIIEALLKQGGDPNCTDVLNLSPFHTACIRNNDPAVVALMIKYGADPNAVGGFDKIKERPLQSAASAANPEMLKVLFENGAKIGEYEHDEKRPMIEVVLRGYGFDEAPTIKCIDMLLEHGEDINCKHWRDGWRETTPLMYAAALDHIALVRHLLKCNADAKYVNCDNESALVSSTHREVPTKALVQLCYAAGAPPPSNDFMGKYLPEFIDSCPPQELL